MPARKRALALTLFLILLGLGCRRAAVYNVPRTNFAATHTSEEVGQLIEHAAMGLGWEVEPVQPGEMVATLRVRRHRATVTINYDATSYEIRYSDSERLKYDGKNIHRNYNNWIQKLERRVNRALVGEGKEASRKSIPGP